MSFLSLFFLAALPLAAAPLVLHLFDRRRSVPIPWGAMQFLLEAATRRTSVRRFQHWLLLLLRVLSVAALVVALARPLVPGHWFGANDRRETILVIDNSMSVQQRLDDGTVFDELLARAEQTIDGLDPGGAVRILSMSPYPAWVTPAGMRVDAGTRPQLINVLRTVRATQGTSDIPAALLKAVQAEAAGDRLVGRRVILLTDGQRKDWRTDDSTGWDRFQAAFDGARIPTELEVVEAGKNESIADNLAVAQLRSNRTVVGVGQPLSVTGKVHSHSRQPLATHSVTWFVNDEKQAEDTLPAMQPGETYDVVWQHSFSKPGVYLLTCRIDADDDLKPDDSDSIVVEVVERVPVLLVEGSDGIAEMQQDTYLVRAALGRIEGAESENWKAIFEPRTVPPQRLESIDLGEFDVVVIPNVTELSGKAVERLTQFVTGGGGLWLALGPRTDINVFNRLLFREGDGLSPVPLSRIVDESSDELQKPTINPFQKSHSATADLADHDRLDTGDVTVSRRFRFQMPTESQGVSVLLDLSNDEPLVVENRVGAGRVIVQAIPLRYQWSGLAVSQAFVVMVHNWLGYLAEPQAARHNLLPGDPILLHVAETDDTHATLTTPGGDVPLTGEHTDRGVLFRTSHTSLPGNYSLETGLAGTGIPFHVARDSGESDLTPLTAGDRTFLSETAGLQGGRRAPRIQDPNLRAPIWPALLMLLVALMAGELVLSGIISRKRFGAAPIAETAEQMTGPAVVLPPMPSGERSQGHRRYEEPVPAEVNA